MMVILICIVIFQSNNKLNLKINKFMKHFLLVSVLLAISSTTAYSQLKVYSNGNVGIARTSSSSYSKLTIGEVNNNYSNYSTGLLTSLPAIYGQFNIGVEGMATSTSALNGGRAFGVCGLAGNTTSGYNYGVLGGLYGSQNGAGIFGTLGNTTGVIISGRYAGYFDGPAYVDGNLTAKALLTPSDIRLKENVVSLSNNENSDNTLSNILDMNVIEYNLKDINSETDSATTTVSAAKTRSLARSTVARKRYYGLSAQELQQIYPDMVTEQQNGYLAVNYVELVPILIRSIQELKSEIDDLKPSSSEDVVTTQKFKIALALKKDNILYQNTPNPFKENTEIRFQLSADAKNSLICIFDMQGKMLKQISIDPSQSSITIDGTEFNAGMYLYSLVINGNEIDTKRMILTK